MHKTISGCELFYKVQGRGPPVLLMHGGLGLDHSYFRPWLDTLADTSTLIYYDHRGNGRSGGRDQPEALTFERLADDAEMLCGELGHEQVVVFGHGLGGFVAQAYALRHPQRVRGLILCATAPALDYLPAMLQGAQQACTASELATLVAGLSQPVASDEALRALWEATLPVYFHRRDPKTAQAIAQATHFCAQAYNRAMFSLASAFDVHPALARVPVPALVVGGRHDWFMPPLQGTERLAQILPHATVRVFEESGHFPFIEEPTRFLRTLRDFFKSL